MTTIENPTAGQLEAGGTVSGFLHGLPFTDWPVTYGGLYLKCGPWTLVGPGDVLINTFVVTSYTPPEVAPWWEACPDDAWIEAFDIDQSHASGGERLIMRCIDWGGCGLENREPRRVHVSDYDTTAPVPRDALDKLRVEFESVPGWSDEGVAGAISALLAAVDAETDK